MRRRRGSSWKWGKELLKLSGNQVYLVQPRAHKPVKAVGEIRDFWFFGADANRAAEDQVQVASTAGDNRFK